MVHLLAKHLKAIIDDIQQEPVKPLYQPLVSACLKCLKAWHLALIDYFVTKNSDQLNKALIMPTMEFLDCWEIWIGNLSNPDLASPRTKIFHEFLLRFSKGILKSWRIWRIDLYK